LPDELEPKPLVPMGELHARCYLRFTALDRPGVLSHITGALGEHGISIESVIQKGRGHPGQSVPVIVLTQPSKESAVRAALAQIDRLPDVTEATRLVRIEEDL
jgi:homoserine dehydrogenase